MHATTTTTNPAATAALHQAAARADERGVLRALGAGADVNALDEAGRSVLWLALLGDSDIETAADAGNAGPEDAARVAVLGALLKAPGISLMTLNAANIVTPLALAAWLNRPKSVLAVLRDSDGAAAVDCMDAGGATPLMYAARDGSVDVARILLGHGARADLCDAHDRSVCQHALGSPQILWMCELALRRQRFRSYARKMKLIASSGPPNMPGAAGQQQLQALIAASLPPDAAAYSPPSASRLSKRALETATRSVVDAVKLGNADVLHTLLFPPHSSLAPPILVNLPDAFGLTPLQHAVSVDEPRVEVIDALYRAGADPSLPTSDSTGRSALHLFARHAHDGPGMYQLAIHLVHELRCSLGAQDAKGETPLHVAAEYGLSGDVLLALLDCDVDGAVRDVPNSRGLIPREVAQPQFAALFAPEARAESALTVRERPASFSFNYTYPAASTLSLSTASSVAPRRPSAPDPALAMGAAEAAKAARLVAAVLAGGVDMDSEENRNKLGEASRLALALVGSWSARLDRALDEAAALRSSRARAGSLLGKAREACAERAAELEAARRAEKEAAKVRKKSSFFGGMRRAAAQKDKERERAAVDRDRTKSAPDLRGQGQAQTQSLVGVIRGMMRGRGMTLASSPSKSSIAAVVCDQPRSPTGSMFRASVSPTSPASPQWMPMSPTGSFVAPWSASESNPAATLVPDESAVRRAPKLFGRIEEDMKALDAALSELDHLISRTHHAIRSADASIEHAIARREEEALDAWFTAALDRPEHDFDKPLPPPPTPPKTQTQSQQHIPGRYQPSLHARNSSISSSVRSRSRSFSRSITVASTAPTSLPGSPVAAQGSFPHQSRHAKMPSLDGLVTVAAEGLPALLAATAAQLDAVEKEVERLTTWTRVARETVKAARRAFAA